MAVNRGAAKHKNISLSNLVATLTRHSLNKDATVRVSTHWADAVLPPEFCSYAAFDAYAIWKVYATLNTMGAMETVTTASPGGCIQRTVKRWPRV